VATRLLEGNPIINFSGLTKITVKNYICGKWKEMHFQKQLKDKLRQFCTFNNEKNAVSTVQKSKKCQFFAEQTYVGWLPFSATPSVC
jgi:hypothetical protein